MITCPQGLLHIRASKHTPLYKRTPINNSMHDAMYVLPYHVYNVY